MLNKLATGFAIFGAVMLCLICLLTCLSIIGTYFSMPVRGDYEIVEQMAFIAIFSFFPIAQYRQSHAQMSFFEKIYGQTGLVVTDLIAHSIYLVCWGILLWAMFRGLESFVLNEQQTMLLRLPVWPSFILPILAVSLSLLIVLQQFYHVAKRLCGER